VLVAYNEVSVAVQVIK